MTQSPHMQILISLVKEEISEDEAVSRLLNLEKDGYDLDDILMSIENMISGSDFGLSNMEPEGNA